MLKGNVKIPTLSEHFYSSSLSIYPKTSAPRDPTPNMKVDAYAQYYG